MQNKGLQMQNKASAGLSMRDELAQFRIENGKLKASLSQANNRIDQLERELEKNAVWAERFGEYADVAQLLKKIDSLESQLSTARNNSYGWVTYADHSKTYGWGDMAERDKEAWAYNSTDENEKAPLKSGDAE